MIKGDNILNVGTPAGGGISIIANDPVTSGGGGGDSPPITTNLLVYYNPDVEVYSDDIGTPAEDGDNIRQFNDQSGNGNTLNQTSASIQPIYDTTRFGNGNAAIKPQYGYLMLTDDLDLDNSTSWTWYFVYELTNTLSYYQVSGNSGYPRTEFSSTKINFRANSGSERFVLHTNTNSLTILAITVDRSSGDYKMYINGSYVGASAYSISDWPVTIQRIYRGLGTYSGINMFYTDAHDATDVGTISDWLNDKYQIY